MKKDILNKIILTTFMSTAILGTTVLADTHSADINAPAQTQETVDIKSFDIENCDYVLFGGKVTEIEDDNDFKAVTILETGLKANISKNTVVIDANDGSIKNVSDIALGTDIFVVVGKNTPMTMSIPPITSSVSAVIINTDSNTDFSVYNNELVNSQNTLKLNIDNSVAIKNIKGETISSDSIKNNIALVFYAESTRSIPAQTTPSTVVVFEKSQSTVDKSPVKLREISESKGYTVKWTSNDAPIEIKKDDRTIIVTPNSNECTINGVKTELSENVYLQDQTMFAPYDFADIL